MDEQHAAVQDFENALPETLERYTDIYFTWSREAAEAAGINPDVTKVVHAGPRDEADVAGLEETAAVYDAMTDDQVDIYLSQHDTFDDREPLMVVEGPLQQLFEPETVALGTLSYHLTDANTDLGYEYPDPEEYGAGVKRVTEMLDDLSDEVGEDIGFADFGARHYHPARQSDLAVAAYDNRAIGHSTREGADAINDAFGTDIDPSGTMPHAFVLGAASRHGMEDATLEAFKYYDEVVDGPTPVLVDTNNAERDDTLRICDHLAQEQGEEFDLVIRMDTNYANYAQTVPDDEQVPGNEGMSVAAVRGMADALRDHGYRDNVTFLISSGMGNTEKLERFVDAAEDYHAETGDLMFDGVGAGTFDTTDTLYTTSDIVRSGEDWLGKVGRLETLRDAVDGDLDAYKQEHMRRYDPDR